MPSFLATSSGPGPSRATRPGTRALRSARRLARAPLLLAAGVVVGTALRGAPTPVSRPSADAPGPAVRGVPAAPPPSPGPAPEIAVTPADAPSPAPGDPAPFFASPSLGGEYATLIGAEGVDEGPVQVTAVMPPAPDRIVAAPPADSSGRVGAEPADAPAAAGTRARFRPAPARGIPRGLALRLPLLARRRAGGSVAFHALGTAAGPAPAGLEGEWAVVGRCERVARVEFSLPVGSAGELRAVGRAGAGEEWAVEPVVARQACSAAAGRFRRPRTAGAAERAAYGGLGAGAGFGPGDLREVLDGRGPLLLVFARGGAGAAVLAAAPGGGAPEVVWSHVASGDGALRLVGVYRHDGGSDAWVTLGDPASPAALLVASTPDGVRWTAAGPVPLRAP